MAGPVLVPAEELTPAAAEETGAEATGKKGKKKGSRKKQGYEWLVLVAASLAVALFVRGFLIQAFYIPSESMVPTLVKNDRVLVNKLSYKLHDVHRGDVVVFTAPPGAATAQVKDLIKRVVGLPGETIEGRNGSIFINNKPLDEPYLPPDVRSRDFPPEKVPPKRVWVLGDNRQDKSLPGIDPAEIAHDEKRRNQKHLERHEKGDDKDPKQSTPSRERHLGDGEAGCHRQHQLQSSHTDREDR